MMQYYFVNVTKANGWTDRWEMLTKQQANFIYAEQVEMFGADACTTGKL
jgi:hypothetical protein